MSNVEEIVELTKKLIEFESIAGKPEQLTAVVDFVEDYLSQNTKLELTRLESNGKPSLVGVFSSTQIPDPALRAHSGSGILKSDPGSKAPKVFFHDHLDVVPGKPEQFKPYVKGDRLYGRGASDTKTNGAVLMVLAKELSAKKIPGKIPDPALRAQLRIRDLPDIGFMFTTDEEIGGQNGVKFLLEKGYKCQFFVTCEPTRFDIVPAHKGILWVKVLVKGKASHASRPWNGENGALKAYKGLSKLYEIYPLPKKEAWKTTVNVGYIAGGDAFNRVMSECELKLDIRFIEKDNPDDIINHIKKCFPGSKVEVVEKEAGMDTKFNDPWVKKLADSVKRISGRASKLKKGHGACDGRFYSAVGIPAVEFGTPANGLHTDDEFVYIKPLETFYRILWDFISQV